MAAVTAATQRRKRGVGRRHDARPPTPQILAELNSALPCVGGQVCRREAVSGRRRSVREGVSAGRAREIVREAQHREGAVAHGWADSGRSQRETPGGRGAAVPCARGRARGALQRDADRRDERAGEREKLGEGGRREAARAWEAGAGPGVRVCAAFFTF